MRTSKIEWTDTVWNPFTGCTPVSEGCQNCYAKRMANRLRGRCGYPADDPFAATLHPDRLEEPLHWKKPRKVFVCSMGDLFHDDVPFSYIAAVFGVMAVCRPQHKFIVLTKRPDRMKEFFDWLYLNAAPLTARPYRNVPYDDDKINLWVKQKAREHGARIDIMRTWPLSNVWLGVTAENQQRADERIPILLQIPAAVRFVSVEPMLGLVDLTGIRFDRNTIMNVLEGCGINRLSPCQSIPNAFCEKIDWVICGGETGPGARPMHPDWARSIRDQCQAAGVPFFFKQWGEYVPCDYEGMDFGASYIDSQCINGELWDLDNCDSEGRLYSTGDNPTCPKCKGSGFLRVGKKAAGRILDGREWNEFPEVAL